MNAKVVFLFSLVCTLGGAACPDLKEPVDLKEAMPALTLTADKMTYVMPKEAGKGFPEVTFSKVKFAVAPKTAVIDHIKNGDFELRVAQNKLENDKSEEWFSVNTIGFQIVSDVNGSGLAGFYASYFDTDLNKPDLKGKITKSKNGAYLFDSAYTENKLQWKMTLTLTGTKITNIELTQPVYKEVRRQEENREFQPNGTQSLCIESYQSADVTPTI